MRVGHSGVTELWCEGATQALARVGKRSAQGGEVSGVGGEGAAEGQMGWVGKGDCEGCLRRPEENSEGGEGEGVADRMMGGEGGGGDRGEGKEGRR